MMNDGFAITPRHRLIEITLPFIILSLLILFSYDVIGYLTSLRSVDYSSYIVTRLDYITPFIPYFIIPYISIVVYPFVVFYMLYRRIGSDLQKYRCIYASFIVLLMLHICLWVLFPVDWYKLQSNVNYVQLSKIKILGALIWYNHKLCSPWNSFPSLHVAFPWFAMRFLEFFTNKKYWHIRVWTVAIILSTVFIKAHYYLDVVAGVMLGQMAFMLMRYLYHHNVFQYTRSFSFRIVYFCLAVMMVIFSPLGLYIMGINIP